MSTNSNHHQPIQLAHNKDQVILEARTQVRTQDTQAGPVGQVAESCYSQLMAYGNQGAQTGSGILVGWGGDKGTSGEGAGGGSTGKVKLYRTQAELPKSAAGTSWADSTVSWVLSCGLWDVESIPGP